jgi:uncharacterized protein (DUF924 family)
MPARIEAILSFWFGLSRTDPDAVPERLQRWFRVDAEFDAQIRGQFSELHAAAAAGELSEWEQTPRGTLALILLLDQFSRNLFRGTPEAIAEDAVAQRLCLEGIERGHDEILSPMERGFFYMPLQHAEHLHLQEQSMRCYRALLQESAPEWRPHIQGMLDYAIEHRDIIQRFGRFPHRNAILGRRSTAEEEERLVAAGANNYGQAAVQ